MRPVYRHPDPAYYWAPPNVEGEPIWGEPYNYYRGVPQGWGYGKYEGGPYWHRHRPAEDGYYYNGSKYRDQGPQFYERDGRDFGRDFDRGFGRDFSPVYVYPSPAPAAAFRPFHPGEQFRHPDEYPMRFVPVTYGSSGPREMEQVKQHCCGCPNHVCHPETSTGKGVERKCLMDSNTEDAKTKLQSTQELAEPVVWFNPSEWWNRASDSKDQNGQKEQEKEEHPVKWIPLNQNRNEGDKEQIRQFPGYWIPLALNQRPKGGEEEKKIPGYWIPLDLSTGPLGPEAEKKNLSYERKLQPFPMLWIPEGNWKAANPREGSGTKNEIIEEEHKKTDEADGRPVIVQEGGKEDEKQVPVQGGKETKVRDIPVKQLEEGKSVQAQKTDENLADNHKLSSSRACKLLEVKKEDEKQRLVDGRKETKIRDIPVKQLGEGKSVQAQKTEEKKADNDKVSSPRASKLPPVCLRVDPLPGKKKNNGKSSSRSPSPPRKEENTKDNAISKSAGIATPNASVGKNIKSDASNVTEEANLKFPQVFGEEKKSDEIESSKTRLTSEIKNAEDLKASKVTGEAMKVEENLNVKCQQSRDKKTELGRDQAALKIQAFYRGCLVRKLQPLRKLREIADIRKRVEEHKQQILSSEFVGELSRDDKTKGRMSETLMCLLLQLDTIQGLHPVVRDVRKSVARELVQLQEKLDTLVEEAHISNSHPCTTDMIEDNVTAVQEKIDDRDKGLEATEECGETLITTSTKNQQVAIQISKDDENAHEKETYMQGSPEIGNEASNNYREDVFVEKEANDGKEETENVITKYGENVTDNSSVQQDALEVSDNLEIPYLSMLIQKAETVNEDENVVNERELVSSVTSEDIISIVNNAGVSLQNVAKENKEKSDPSLENISLENEEKSKPDTPMETDSAPPQGLDAAVRKEICPAPTLDQEQEVAAFDNSSTLDETTFTLEKSGTLEQVGKPVVVMLEAEECDATTVKEICPASTLVQEQEVAASDNSSTVDENADALEKNATLEQGGKLVVIMPDAEPDKKMSAEKDKMSSSEEVSSSEDNINKTGSEELQNALTEKTAGVDNLEFNTEAFSQAVSDGLSVSHSDGIDKIKLDKVEKALPAAENLSEMGEFAVAMVQGTDEPIIEKSTIAHITGDGLATMNTKIDLSIQDEEHAPKGMGTSDGTESGASDKVDKLVMESSLNKNDLVHSENISESEAYNTKSVRNQDPEKWEEENENLREMVQKLVEAEKNQMSIIVRLNDKIKQLENKLSKGNGMRKARAGQLRLRSNRVARNSKNATALGC